MKLCVSGTPCTGKTTISKKLSNKLGWELISVNNLAEELNAYLGKDKIRNVKILDMEKIINHLEKIKEDVIIEGHTSHEVPCDTVVILRCNPEILEKRLKKRYPNNPEKVDENVDAEILGVITSEATDYNDKIYEVNTSKETIDQNVDDITRIINGETKDYEIGKNDWLEKYEKELI